MVAPWLVFWPALGGGFVYDDFAFFVDNPAVHVQSLELAQWMAAATGFPAAHQGRWLGMLSFAANYYADGLNPWGWKLVNLLIHVLNGVLVWRVVAALLRLRDGICHTVSGRVPPLAAMALAALWLILPINFTPAQYIGQRLESLSNTFVLLGLLAYLRLRLRDWTGHPTGLRMPFAVLCFTAAGMLVKESAVLLPAYVACVEFALARMRRADGSWSRPAASTLILCLGVPLLVGLIWLSTWVGGERAYARNYDSIERLLTQGRVLWLYMQWTLLPNLNDLTRYHDDILPSRGLLTPWTTLPALAGIVGLLMTAWWVRARAPLLSLGILWYFAGHALTATVIPLMLAFEHRNYFPSIGLLLAVFAAVRFDFEPLRPRLQVLLFAAAALLYAGTTHFRAFEWGQPLRLAASEALKRPASVDAQHSYVNALVAAAGPDLKGEYGNRAIAELKAHRQLPGAEIVFEATLAILKARRGERADVPWTILNECAQARAPSIRDVSGVISLYECMKTGPCDRDFVELRALMEQMLAHPQTDVSLFSAYAELVSLYFGDVDAALLAYSRAVAKMPKNPSIYFNRAVTLIRAGRAREAQGDIEMLRNLDILGSNRSYLAAIDQVLQPAAAGGSREDGPDSP